MARAAPWRIIECRLTRASSVCPTGTASRDFMPNRTAATNYAKAAPFIPAHSRLSQSYQPPRPSPVRAERLNTAI